ncbi:GntR family transcriptional regulator [Bradyrhizobium sp. PRIMUS42]|uniref:GntR family transcriptional regulator n=1 Tax=Bradyrhizobium sp. PRIMUS42 TaxID=2908926 RepID=UPI0034D96D15
MPVTAAPLRHQVASNLRTANIGGRFEPGERLKENELCSWTGVSRTAGARALRHHEAEGIVDNIPSQGPVVRAYRQPRRQHYEVRGTPELLTARTAAQNNFGARDQGTAQAEAGAGPRFQHRQGARRKKVRGVLDGRFAPKTSSRALSPSCAPACLTLKPRRCSDDSASMIDGARGNTGPPPIP